MKNQAKKTCTCRPAKSHRDCCYCGNGLYDICGRWRICGYCKEAGIDGLTIPGTSRVVCKAHKGGTR